MISRFCPAVPINSEGYNGSIIGPRHYRSPAQMCPRLSEAFLVTPVRNVLPNPGNILGEPRVVSGEN